MTPPPTIEPCPNPECGKPVKVQTHILVKPGEPMYSRCQCAACGYEGPRHVFAEYPNGKAEKRAILDEAIRLHNLLCRPTPQPTREAAGTNACPICGKDEPHGHDREQIETWVNGRLSAWGWKAHVYNDSTDKPYGWYYVPHHVGFIIRFTLSKPDDIYGYIPLYAHPPKPTEARELNLKWGRHDGRGEYHIEWHAPCGCAYHPEPKPHVHSCIKHAEIDQCQD